MQFMIFRRTLREDSPQYGLRGIHLLHKLSGRIRVDQNWGLGEPLLEFSEGKLSLRSPVKLARGGGENGEKCSYAAVVLNEPPVGACKTQKNIAA